MVDVAVNKITIAIPAKSAILTLCEVYIYASFLRKKNNYCSEKCQTGNSCNNVNFTCPLCELGWKGPYCTPIKCPKPQLPGVVTITPDKLEYAYRDSVSFGCRAGYTLNGDKVKTCLQSADFGQNLPSCADRLEYAYRDSVSFGCRAGYTLNGDKVKTCLQSADFRQNLPSCAAIRCPKPQLPGFVTITPDRLEYAYRDSVSFGCRAGYTLNGYKVKTCLQSADFGQNLPSCAAIRCPKPQLPGFVTITPDRLEYAYRDSVSFGCRAGYTLNGYKVKTCLQSADFGQNLPSCAAIRCPKPQLPGFVTITPDRLEYAYRDSVSFGCRAGYTLNGDKVKTCLQSADFGQNLPSCAAIRCPKPQLPGFVTITPNRLEYAYRVSVSFGCRAGYTLNGDKVKTCLQSADFGQNLPSCAAIRCPKPQLPGFVTITPDRLEYAYGVTVSFGCRVGYTLNGDKVKTCLQSADFGQNLPSCAAIRCPKPQLPGFVTITPDRLEYAYGVTVSFECRVGYTLNGDKVKTCLQSADFGQNLPSCAAIKCPKPQSPGFVTITPDKPEYAYRDTVSFGCRAGYTLNGDNVKTCLQSANFGQDLPSCEDICQSILKFMLV
uniref:Sushi domain-containing protein n=1 Tax=Magallana gigas TaxID=29159 RepID=A0A8W8MGA5_MAGGI